jgi:hypothetical protein
MFPTSINLLPGQKLINLDKMPSFYQLEPKQQMIDLSKMPKFCSALDLSSQEPLSIAQDCPLSASQ